MLDLKSFQIREESYTPGRCNPGQNERRDFMARIKSNRPEHVSIHLFEKKILQIYKIFKFPKLNFQISKIKFSNFQHFQISNIFKFLKIPKFSNFLYEFFKISNFLNQFFKFPKWIQNFHFSKIIFSNFHNFQNFRIFQFLKFPKSILQISKIKIFIFPKSNFQIAFF